METIQKQFVTYEIALVMKELGFNEMCIATFDEDKDFDLQNFEQNYDTFPSHIIAVPLWQQCVDWFREQFNLMINSPVPDEWNTGKWSVKLESLNKKMILEEHVGQPYWRIYRGFDSYEKAKEQAILKCIKLCKKQKEI